MLLSTDKSYHYASYFTDIGISYIYNSLQGYGDKAQVFQKNTAEFCASWRMKGLVVAPGHRKASQFYPLSKWGGEPPAFK